MICQKCGAWSYTSHTCPPTWLIWDADEPAKEPNFAYGVDMDDAAERHAEFIHRFRKWYGGERSFLVANPATPDQRTRFSVLMEYDPTFFATKQESAEPCTTSKQ